MRILVLAAMAGAFALVGGAEGAHASAYPDNPEPGQQGEQIEADNPGSLLERPYSKGVRVLGHNAIEGRDSNIQLLWVDHCAYVSSTGGPFPLIGVTKGDTELTGVAVIDVSDPTEPKLVKFLRDKGSMAALETIDAVTAPDGRKVLVAGAYHGGTNAAGTSGSGHDPEASAAWVDIYDVSDCADPKLMAKTSWPENSHSLTISPDGRHVYGTAMSPFTGAGGLQVLDISDMAKPRFTGKFGATRPDGSSFEFASHEISFSLDGRRIYAGVNSSKSDHLNQGIALLPPNAEALGPKGGGVFILDNSDFVEGDSDPKLRLIRAIPAAGWHSVMPANIGGVPHLVGGAELGACPGTWPIIINIANETSPFIAGSFRLDMNDPKSCPERENAGNGISGIVPTPDSAALHYNDVDSASDTRLGLFNFLWAGLRIADLRDPADPVELGYFKPGDACTGHVRYLRESGQIWLTCTASGFWVLQLSPELQAAVGLPGLEKE
ncbi:MAG: hypothetical protein P8J20_10150 [Novosphingobium sp.]|nr:hypothetical protein [Novosphingobium sp.]